MIVFGFSCSIYSKSKRNTKGKMLNLKKSKMKSYRWKKCWKILKKRYMSPKWTFSLAHFTSFQWQWKCPGSCCNRKIFEMWGWLGIKSPISRVILESRALLLPVNVSPWHFKGFWRVYFQWIKNQYIPKIPQYSLLEKTSVHLILSRPGCTLHLVKQITTEKTPVTQSTFN